MKIGGAAAGVVKSGGAVALHGTQRVVGCAPEDPTDMAIHWDSVSGLIKGQARGFSSLPGAFVLRDIEGSCKVVRVDKRTSRYYAVYWSLGSPELSVSDFDIDQVNSALMLCLIKERALRQIEEHYYYEFLSELIDGTLETTGEIKARASRLRRNVHDAYQLIVSSSDSAVVSSVPSISSLRNS